MEKLYDATANIASVIVAIYVIYVMTNVWLGNLVWIRSGWPI